MTDKTAEFAPKVGQVYADGHKSYEVTEVEDNGVYVRVRPTNGGREQHFTVRLMSEMYAAGDLTLKKDIE